MQKKIVLPMLAAVVVGTAVFGGGYVSAQTNGDTSTLVQMIAQKFGLDQNAVQSVVNQYRSQQKVNMQQKMQARLKTKLDQEVSQGKITPTQEQSILSEISSLQNKYLGTSFRSLTATQKKQALENMQSDLKSWANSQGIDLSLIPMYRKVGMGKFRMGNWSKATPSISPST